MLKDNAAFMAHSQVGIPKGINIMVPLIVAIGAVVAGTAAFFGLKAKCKICDSVFTLNETCLHCGAEVCGDCGVTIDGLHYRDWPLTPSGRVCAQHKGPLDNEIVKLKRAIEQAESIRVFSKNFKGRTPGPMLGKAIETQFHTDKDLAERELRIRAALEGASFVVSAEFMRDVQVDGNYRFTVWKAQGSI